MADYRITLTSAGLELLAKATAGKVLVFTGVQLGDGDAPDSFQDMAALISPRKTLPIRSVIHIGAKANIKAVLDYTAITEDFQWKEVGLIAADPDTDQEVLYCYGNAGNKGDWITSGITATAKSINLTVLVSEAASVTAVIDDKANYAAVDLSNVESAAVSEKIKDAVIAGELTAADLQILKRQTIILPAGKWTGSSEHYTQEAEVQGISADESAQAVWVAPTSTSMNNWNNAMCMASAQSENHLTFSAQEKPVSDMMVYVFIMEVVLWQL